MIHLPEKTSTFLPRSKFSLDCKRKADKTLGGLEKVEPVIGKDGWKIIKGKNFDLLFSVAEQKLIEKETTGRCSLFRTRQARYNLWACERTVKVERDRNFWVF